MSPSSESNGTMENGSMEHRKNSTFYHKDLQIERASPAQMKPRPRNMADVKFGQIFSDHMVEVDWTLAEGWTRPRICPIHEFHFHPATKIFHYAPSVFEGMKAFRGVDGNIRMFRPEKNMARMVRAAARASLPSFDPKELLALIVEFVRLEVGWIPSGDTSSSLYIRPSLIATDATLELSSPKSAKLYVIACPVGAYFPTGLRPVTVLADPNVARAFPGGVGGYKMGCNYAPTIHVGKVALEKYGCDQVLWLSGEDEKLTEVGVMNFFVFWCNEEGELELVTPPTADCLVLDGVVRESVLEIARKWGEFRVNDRRYLTIPDMRRAIREERIVQMFGTGTACAVCPVAKIVYKRKGGEELEVLEMSLVKKLPKELDLIERFYTLITGIQYGQVEWKDGEREGEGNGVPWIRMV